MMVHMITPFEERENLMRVTVTLDPVDVALLDRLAKLEGLNRSAELRAMLAQLRPILRATIEAFEGAMAQRERLNQAAANASLSEFEDLMPELEKLQNSYMGAVSRLEGKAAVAAARAETSPENPRPSNHGGHTPTPPPTEDL